MATKAPQKNTEKDAVAAGRKRVLAGKVVSTKMKDTVVVLIERYEKHPKYQKFMKKSKRYQAHDAGNTLKMGDMVRIEECAPISKNKHFKVIEKTADAKAAPVEIIDEVTAELK